MRIIIVRLLADGNPLIERPLTSLVPVRIGRDAGCDIALASPQVSRQHLVLSATSNGVRVEDSSTNGTLIGDVIVRQNSVELPAPSSTLIQLGPYRLTLECIVQDVAPPPTAFETQPPTHAAATSVEPPPLPLRPSAPAGNVATPGASPQRDSSPRGRTDGVSVALRKQIHRMILDNLDLAALDRSAMDEAKLRPNVEQAIERILLNLQAELPADLDRVRFIKEMSDEVLGLGPLEELLADTAVSEIMVVDPKTIFVERRGQITLTDLKFTDDESIRAVVERIVTPLGRRIDESSPLVDARLKDGSRVNIVIPPLALKGACVTIRKFPLKRLTIEDLISYGALTEQMAQFLRRTVAVRKNILISGGTGSGKTTLLNVLSASIPEGERIITIEDAAELQLHQPHVVSLETRPANMEGKGEYTIRDLVRNALRMRPDRIVVGECRGGEALDMLQAMNTGHDGSMTTTHSSSPTEALKRLETLCLMAGVDLPSRAIREQIASSIHVIIQQTRFADGSRRISSISEVVGISRGGEIELNEIFSFTKTHTEADGRIRGEFRPSGYLPTFIADFITAGLVTHDDYL